VTRFLKPITLSTQSHCMVNGKTFVNFSSNDYLGLATYPKLQKEVFKKAKALGLPLGSSGSRLLTGDYPLLHTLETQLAQFKGSQAALVLNTGYQTNITLLQALVGPKDGVFVDKAMHASVMDGLKLIKGKFHRYAHLNYAHLKTLLTQHRSDYENVWIVTESVFSMDGDCVDMDLMFALKKEFNTKLYVDEAHALGVFGTHGEGLVSRENTWLCDIMVGTFGKAWGSFGAFVACSEETKHKLINEARGLLFSTALPPLVTLINTLALPWVEHPKFRKKLWNNVRLLKRLLKAKNIAFLGQSHIIPIVFQSPEKTGRIAKTLQEAGFWVLPIFYPTVPAHLSRIRLSLSATHTPSDIKALVTKLDSLVN